MSYKFKVGDKGKTRGGKPYRVICVDRVVTGGSCVVALLCAENGIEYFSHHTPDGRRLVPRQAADDLMPPTVTKWLDVWMVSGGSAPHGSIHEKQTDAASNTYTNPDIQWLIKAQPIEVQES